MPTTEQLRNRLINKLKELFQLDQPDLDFGFYRIMHAKSDQVLNFLENDLLKTIEEAFGRTDDTRQAELKAAYDKAVEQAKEFGVKNPEESAPVKKAKATLNAVKDTASSEGEVYDHLYRFFERYYNNGDFISCRYFTRETSGKAAPYAIPYNGEEVKLHWANADQYYIKTAEYFNNFTFDLRKAKEVQNLNKRDLIDIKINDNTEPLIVHFRIAEAAEGEHGNIKASETEKRYFIIHRENPVEMNNEGELVIHFEYRPDTEKSGQENTWREKRNTEAVKTIFDAIKKIAGAKEYRRLLETPAPTDKDNSRTLLAKYINKYTARNTYDYFIHKDLRGFLCRELDFYIKNEVMRLDDIESADIPTVETYLGKLRVLRKIAGKLIDFIAHLEDFQKKLWLKKKFVVETNYCITLDRVPENLYPEIVGNKAQHDEWVKLFAIDEIERDLSNPGYTKPLTVKFLKANNKLVLDTRFFKDSFKSQLISSIENFDDQCDGLLIHSENLQALNLISSTYSYNIEMVYTDPPYNKRKDNDFAYKDSFQHSSWIAMIYDRLLTINKVIKQDACLFISIDENEFNNLYFAGHNLIGYAGSKVLPAITNLKGNQDTEGFASCHEYVLAFAKRSLADIGRLPIDEEVLLDEWLNDEYGLYKQADGLRATGANAPREKRRNLWYPIFFLPNGSDFYTTENDIPKHKSHIAIWPINDDGEELSWYWKKDKVNSEKYNLIIKKSRNGNFTLYKKQRPGIGDIPTRKPKSFIYAPEYSSTHGGNLAQEIFNQRMSSFTPKSVKLIEDLIYLGLKGSAGTVLDIFAGSGTTGHAVINLNRKYLSNGNTNTRMCKYILVEMGDYFNTFLIQRLSKVVYSVNWKDGKPTARGTGISHCFKYIRLESYEDTLNNLRFAENSIRDQTVSTNSGLKEDYMLHYMLDVETRGSQSLLNIDAFTDPESYQLKIKKSGSDEYTIRNVDLLETFNYLIGLRITHIATPQIFNAKFKREPDPELPEDQHTRLVINGRIKQDENGSWWFRKVEGWVPANPNQPNNGKLEKVLIVWRKLTGNLEKDNLILDEWFQKNRISTRDFEFDTIYVNGSNNLPNLKLESENWKVRLIEEDFMRLMWEMENL
ncbi:MAG: site-specific DNA-methyltransferase [Proteobacteria bacterium]|nr:site-specific DNA-methyltransferase [Pseudomonadota bacterium]